MRLNVEGLEAIMAKLDSYVDKDEELMLVTPSGDCAIQSLSEEVYQYVKTSDKFKPIPMHYMDTLGEHHRSDVYVHATRTKSLRKRFGYFNSLVDYRDKKEKLPKIIPLYVEAEFANDMNLVFTSGSGTHLDLGAYHSDGFFQVLMDDVKTEYRVAPCMVMDSPYIQWRIKFAGRFLHCYQHEDVRAHLISCLKADGFDPNDPTYPKAAPKSNEDDDDDEDYGRFAKPANGNPKKGKGNKTPSADDPELDDDFG